MSNTWVTIATAIFPLSAILILIFGWHFLKLRQLGVVKTLGAIPEKEEPDGEGGLKRVADLSEAGRGPGGPVLLVPFLQSMRVYTLADIVQPVRAYNVLSAAPNPIAVSLDVDIYLRYLDPAKAILTTPDSDPIDEFGRIAQESVMAAIRAYTVQQLTKSDAIPTLVRFITDYLRSNTMTSRWGLEIVNVNIKNFMVDEDYAAAQELVILEKAKAEAQLVGARAEAEKDAILAGELKNRFNTLGEDATLTLESLQAWERAMNTFAKSGAPNTVISGAPGVDPGQLASMRDAFKNRSGR